MGFNFGKAIVSQVKDRVYKKVVGGVGDIVRGIPGLGNSSILGQLIRTNLNPEHRSFPLDVEQQPGLGNQGHYILFYINEQTNAKLSFGSTQPEAAGFQSVLEEAGNRDIPNYIREIVGQRGIDKYETNQRNYQKLSSLIEDIDKTTESTYAVDGHKVTQVDYTGKMAVNKQLGDMGMSALGTSGAYRGMNVKRKATRRLKTSISIKLLNF